MKLQFLEKNQESRDVWTFRFAPQEATTWQAGQSIRLEVPIGYDIEEKRFTISSAPYEKRIDITTRLSGSKFKNSLDNLKPGQVIDGQSIEGNFVWSPAGPKLFVAAGIGITPFHSMLKQRQHEAAGLDVKLIYGGRPGQLPFADWLQVLAVGRSDFELQLIQGRRLSFQDLGPITGQPIYLSGPTDMVNDLNSQLLAAGLSEQNIKRDLFTGTPGWV